MRIPYGKSPNHLPHVQGYKINKPNFIDSVQLPCATPYKRAPATRRSKSGRQSACLMEPSRSVLRSTLTADYVQRAHKECAASPFAGQLQASIHGASKAKYAQAYDRYDLATLPSKIPNKKPRRLPGGVFCLGLLWRYGSLTTLAALGPLSPSTISNVTFSPSRNVRNPSP